MRRFVLSLVLATALAGASQAQEVRNPEIEGTIRSQIEAFLADDFERAFTFASPTIQGMFVTPENFGIMVQRGYPMVWRPDAVTFGELREVAGGLWQRVIIRDQEGRLHALDYLMTDTPEGWRISAVQVLPAPDVSA